MQRKKSAIAENGACVESWLCEAGEFYEQATTRLKASRMRGLQPFVGPGGFGDA
ncbi:hypothetical protein MHM582_0612 [Microbacterium sp. HM58-2]|nr:hypothetical protein MHM582_0612 [Microbacterium sp. HM58-2]